MISILTSISIIIGIAAILTIIAKLIRQPPIIAYLISGLIVGPLFLNIINTENATFIETFAKLGIALLLFIVGLNLDFRVLKEFGKVSSLAGISEILVMSSLGFLISLAFGFSWTPALYLAAAFAFSSTVVVVKILSDKKEIDTLHGRIALGILIVEDFVAAIILMLIPVLQTATIATIFITLGEIIGITIAVFLISVFIVNKATDYLARSQETLFLFGIAWALIVATAFHFAGLSIEIGALIAGMALASSKYHIELGSKIKPLRDFFVVLLFVYFGSKLSGTITPMIIYEALAFSALIMIGKPIIIMIFMKLLGYKKRTNFLTGSSLAQLSEFSLIIIFLGFSYNQLSQSLMNVAILTSLITIAISSYSIYYSHKIFNKISNLLNIFEGNREGIESNQSKQEEYEVVLFGYHRIGYKIIESLKKAHKDFLIIDYNPKVVLSLAEKGVSCVYGDASDPGFLGEIKLKKTKLVISTIPDETANIAIKNMLKEVESKAIFIATAEQPRQALDLYNQGIDYVVVPHHLGGDYISSIIEKFGTDKNKYDQLGKAHKKQLGKAKDDSNY